MMILVTGGCGVMGRVLVRKLYEAGHSIRVLTLPDDPYVSLVKKYCADIRFGDISRREDLTDVVHGITIVYHLAAIIITENELLFETINIGGTQNLIDESKKEGVQQFIYISSASVVYPKATPYSSSKRKCEKIVQASGLPYTIIRPTLVYDERKGSLEFDMFLAYLCRFPVVPFIGDGKALKRPVFVGDIINGLVAVCNNAKAVGKIYNFSGAEALSILDFSRLCLYLLNMPKKRFVFFPLWFCKVIAGIMKLCMKNPPLKWQVIAGITQDANLDPSDAINDLGYAPEKVTKKLKECFPREYISIT